MPLPQKHNIYRYSRKQLVVAAAVTTAATAGAQQRAAVDGGRYVTAKRVCLRYRNLNPRHRALKTINGTDGRKRSGSNSSNSSTWLCQRSQRFAILNLDLNINLEIHVNSDMNANLKINLR